MFIVRDVFHLIFGQYRDASFLIVDEGNDVLADHEKAMTQAWAILILKPDIQILKNIY